MNHLKSFRKTLVTPKKNKNFKVQTRNAPNPKLFAVSKFSGSLKNMIPFFELFLYNNQYFDNVFRKTFHLPLGDSRSSRPEWHLRRTFYPWTCIRSTRELWLAGREVTFYGPCILLPVWSETEKNTSIYNGSNTPKKLSWQTQWRRSVNLEWRSLILQLGVNPQLCDWLSSYASAMQDSIRTPCCEKSLGQGFNSSNLKSQQVSRKDMRTFF